MVGAFESHGFKPATRNVSAKKAWQERPAWAGPYLLAIAYQKYSPWRIWLAHLDETELLLDHPERVLESVCFIDQIFAVSLTSCKHFWAAFMQTFPRSISTVDRISKQRGLCGISLLKRNAEFRIKIIRLR